MFWVNRDNSDKRRIEGFTAAQAMAVPETCEGTFKDNESQRPEHAELRDKALANTRLAREAIGEDAIRKIAEALTRQQRTPAAQAKAQIEKTDSLRLMQEIRFLMEEI